MHYSGKTERYPLNDDIWSMILSLVGGDDARSLSLASRCIHLVARRLVLSRAELSTPRQLMNACSFMLEDSRHRACWLRELRIRSSALGPRPSSGRLLIDPTLLADCLHAAQNLRTLVLPCVEALVVAEPHLEDALISLSRLDCIELSGIAERASDVTLKMSSRPSQVTLGFVPPMPFPESLSALGSLPLLGNAHTVELRMQLYHSPTAEFKLSTLGRHSSVREVRLVSCTPLPLHHLFPNMRTLRMRGMKYTQSRGWGDWAWPSSVPLAEVTASIADITSLSKAPIRQLYIRETSEFWLHERVRDALIATRPIYLNIRPETWYHGSGGLEALGTFLQASLGQEGRLRCLEVTVTCYTPLEAPLVWVRWLLPIIGVSELLCIKFNYDVVDVTSGIQNTPTALHIEEARNAIARDVPSLKYICNTVGRRGETDPSTCQERFIGEATWWSVGAAPEDPRRVTNISLQAGEALDRYLRSSEFEEKLNLDGFMLP